LIVQRLLSARNERQSRAALLSSWVIIFFQFGLFLLIGVALFVYYSGTGLPFPAKTDRIYPEFVWQNLPPGVAGVVIAAIVAAAMANLSAALNSLTSTTIIDIIKPLTGRTDDAGLMRWARWATVVWAVVLLAIGIVARHWGSVLEAGLTIASILYGSLLGVFLLGLLTRSVKEPAAMAGMVVGLLLMLWVRQFTHVAFTWYVLIGTLATFLVGCSASLLLGDFDSSN